MNNSELVFEGNSIFLSRDGKKYHVAETSEDGITFYHSPVYTLIFEPDLKKVAISDEKEHEIVGAIQWVIDQDTFMGLRITPSSTTLNAVIQNLEIVDLTAQIDRVSLN